MKSNMPLFIHAGEIVDQAHPLVRHFAHMSKDDLRDRWQSEEGRAILGRWRTSGYDRECLKQMVGQLYEQFDLRGAPLAKGNFSGKDLRNIDFFGADLKEANFENAKLNHAHFSEADIRGGIFKWARMDGAFLDNAVFDEKTNFLGVNLHAVNFTLAALLYDQAHTQQRIAHLEKRHPFFAAFLRISCNYGRSLKRWFIWVGIVITAFALVFGYYPGLIEAKGFLNGLYFSVVTFTTLGYGDISPIGAAGKSLAIIEVIFGYLMGGLLIAIFARKVLGD